MEEILRSKKVQDEMRHLLGWPTAKVGTRYVKTEEREPGDEPSELDADWASGACMTVMIVNST